MFSSLTNWQLKILEEFLLLGVIPTRGEITGNVKRWGSQVQSIFHSRFLFNSCFHRNYPFLQRITDISESTLICVHQFLYVYPYPLRICGDYSSRTSLPEAVELSPLLSSQLSFVSDPLRAALHSTPSMRAARDRSEDKPP